LRPRNSPSAGNSTAISRPRPVPAAERPMRATCRARPRAGRAAAILDAADHTSTGSSSAMAASSANSSVLPAVKVRPPAPRRSRSGTHRRCAACAPGGTRPARRRASRRRRPRDRPADLGCKQRADARFSWRRLASGTNGHSRAISQSTSTTSAMRRSARQDWRAASSGRRVRARRAADRSGERPSGVQRRSVSRHRVAIDPCMISIVIDSSAPPTSPPRFRTACRARSTLSAMQKRVDVSSTLFSMSPRDARAQESSRTPPCRRPVGADWNGYSET